MTERAAEPGELIGRLAALAPERRRLLERLRAEAAGRPVLTAVPRDGGPLPASFIQSRLWLVDQLSPRSAEYLVPLAFRIQGELDASALRHSWEYLIERHEALRTHLAWAADRVVQVVHPRVGLPWEELDLSGVADVRGVLARLLAEEASRGLALDDAPLLRLRLLRLAPRDHVLTVVMHHAITDGWSNGILVRELGACYAALAAGQDIRLPPLRVQYADVAAFQHAALTADRLAELTAFWAGQLIGLDDGFTLPADRPRGAEGPGVAGTYRFTLPEPASRAVAALAQATGATSYAVLLATFSAMLSRWAGSTDVPIGSPQSARTHPDMEAVVGPLINSVVLRVDTGGAPSARSLIDRASRVLDGAREHADLPFDQLVKLMRPSRRMMRNPLFQVNLGLGSFPQHSLLLPSALTAPVPLAAAAAKFDLACYLSDGGRTGWHGTLEYDAGLFEHATAVQATDELAELLTGAAADPDRALLADQPQPQPRRPVGGPAPRRGFVAPRNHWEWLISETWSGVLDVAEVGATDDFFALGGHSMAGMLAASRLTERTGVRVGLATIFTHPTVEQLAVVLAGQALQSRPAAAPAELVVPLRAGGDRPALYFAHGAVGELAMYFALAQALPKTRPLFGLQADGLLAGDELPSLSLEDMAGRYADEIAARGGRDLVHLAGFSAAGRLALATAEQLLRRGLRPGAVIMIDTSPLGDVAPDPDLATILARWLPFAPPEDELRRLGRDDQVSATLAAGQRLGDLPQNLDLAAFTRLCRRLEVTARALAAYRSPAYAGVATLLTQAGRTHRDLAAEWRTRPLGGLRVMPVEVSSHMDFAAPSGAAQAAPVIAAAMRKAEEEAP